MVYQQTMEQEANQCPGSYVKVEYNLRAEIKLELSQLVCNQIVILNRIGFPSQIALLNSMFNHEVNDRDNKQHM